MEDEEDEGCCSGESLMIRLLLDGFVRRSLCLENAALSLSLCLFLCASSLLSTGRWKGWGGVESTVGIPVVNRSLIVLWHILTQLSRKPVKMKHSKEGKDGRNIKEITI